MSVARSFVRSVLPPNVHERLRTIYYKAITPFQSPFAAELLRLETAKRAPALLELEECSELKATATAPSAWRGLEGLAYQMVRHYKPKVIVELGTHMGFSALAMGLALRDNGEGGQLFAVDCWEGDPQAGYWCNGEEVYQTFLKRIEQLGLTANIVPLKMYFEQAKDLVAKPIDLLHIDGLHTWDAVSKDFETFGPMVRPGGIVMFHDVNNHFEEVHRYWMQLSKDYEHHMVPHSNGLGILRTKAG